MMRIPSHVYLIPADSSGTLRLCFWGIIYPVNALTNIMVGMGSTCHAEPIAQSTLRGTNSPARMAHAVVDCISFGL